MKTPTQTYEYDMALLESDLTHKEADWAPPREDQNGYVAPDNYCYWLTSDRPAEVPQLNRKQRRQARAKKLRG
jgi:hypothetical protein